MAEEGLSMLMTAIIVIAVVGGSIFFFTFVWNNYIAPNFKPTVEEAWGPPGQVSPQDIVNLPLYSTTLGWPVRIKDQSTPYEISSCFGYRGKIDVPNYQPSKCHPGIDIPAPAGTEVLAASSGTVEREGVLGTGECMRVNSGKFYTRYCHVNPTVKTGKVSVGDLIGTIKKDHVHLEVIEAIGIGKIDSAKICTPDEIKYSAIVVFANPASSEIHYATESYLARGLGDRSPHLNPYCFFPETTQKQIRPRGSLSCKAETGGIAKGCAEYQALLI